MPQEPAPSPAIIDLRGPEAHALDRPVGAVQLLPADLVDCPHLLPSRSCPLILVGGTKTSIAPLLLALEQAGRTVVRHYPHETWREHMPVESGPPSRTRLWEPARVVKMVVEKYGAELTGKRALDLACGTGRNAVYLAMAGFEVTAIDLLPDALERTRDFAARYNLKVSTLQRDLEKPGALDNLSADLIIVVRYLERSLFPAIQETLAPCGLLAYETFTEAQKELGHPRNPRFLLRPGELSAAFPRLRALEHDIVFETAHLERLIAQRKQA